MELKDVILSTLAEMEDNNTVERSEEPREVKNSDIESEHHQDEKVHGNEQQSEMLNDTLKNYTVDNELFFLNSVRERLLVLFEGFQAPNNSKIEAKIDLTLNFLEYLLATIDNRVEILEKGNKE